MTYRFELSPGQRLIQRHPGVPSVDVVEGAGVTTLRMMAPKLWDRVGQEYPITLTLEGDRVTLAAPAGAEFPVVMDPVWFNAEEMSSPRKWHTATLLLDGKVVEPLAEARAGHSANARWSASRTAIALMATAAARWESARLLQSCH